VRRPNPPIRNPTTHFNATKVWTKPVSRKSSHTRYPSFPKNFRVCSGLTSDSLAEPQNYPVSVTGCKPQFTAVLKDGEEIWALIHLLDLLNFAAWHRWIMRLKFITRPSTISSFPPFSLCTFAYHCDARPITEAYNSAFNFTRSPEFLRRHVVTREEYLEMGSNACRRKWKGPHNNVTIKESLKGKTRLRESDDETPARRGGRGRGRGGHGGTRSTKK
jgi:hypothetical protein